MGFAGSAGVFVLAGGWSIVIFGGAGTGGTAPGRAGTVEKEEPKAPLFSVAVAAGGKGWLGWLCAAGFTVLAGAGAACCVDCVDGRW